MEEKVENCRKISRSIAKITTVDKRNNIGYNIFVLRFD